MSSPKKTTARPTYAPARHAGSASRTRTEEVAAYRARRLQNDRDMDMNLSIDESLRDPNFEYRWVNADPKRIRRMERNEWERASNEEMGCETERHAEATKGHETKTVLMRKPADFVEEDRKIKEERRQHILRGRAAGNAAPMTDGAEGLSGAEAYQPKASNSVSYENRK